MLYQALFQAGCVNRVDAKKAGDKLSIDLDSTKTKPRTSRYGTRPTEASRKRRAPKRAMPTSGPPLSGFEA